MDRLSSSSEISHQKSRSELLPSIRLKEAVARRVRFLLPERHQSLPPSLTVQPPSPEPSIDQYEPYPGDAQRLIDQQVDPLLYSQKFEMLCAQAIASATLKPCLPPPTEFVSIDQTPLHSWYRSLVLEFLERFKFLVRSGSEALGIPRRDQFDTDEDTLMEEAKAHITPILRSINTHFAPMLYETIQHICIDKTQPNVAAANAALLVALDPTTQPPKANWKPGQYLHAECRRRLRSFRFEMLRLLKDNMGLGGVLLDRVMERGVTAYEEFYVRQFRATWLEMSPATNNASTRV